MNSKISLIVPVFNEDDEIENFFSELKKCNFNLINEIIFVDDCSTDNSVNLLEENINIFKELNFDVNLLLLKNFKWSILLFLIPNWGWLEGPCWKTPVHSDEKAKERD